MEPSPADGVSTVERTVTSLERTGGEKSIDEDIDLRRLLGAT